MTANKPTLFIADLHLSEEQPETLRQFLALLSGPASTAKALYILGDLFEIWLGDDAIPPYCQSILAAFQRLAEQGVAVYLQHGNRDFLLGETFCQHASCQLLPELFNIDLYGRSTLLMHGDLLCTDDHAYQTLRKQIRDPVWIENFLAKPLQERQNFARSLRAYSEEETRNKESNIMDVNARSVARYMAQQGVSQLIHGHTHRPAQHDLILNGQVAVRHVLPEWQDRPGMLICDMSGCRLHFFDQP